MSVYAGSHLDYRGIFSLDGLSFVHNPQIYGHPLSRLGEVAEHELQPRRSRPDVSLVRLNMQKGSLWVGGQFSG